MGVLAATPALEAGQLPLGPYRTCEALRLAATEAGLPSLLRIRLLRQLEPELLARYTGCVEAMNSALVEEGVLPHLTHVPARVEPRPVHAQPTGPAASTPPPPMPQVAAAPGAFFSGPPQTAVEAPSQPAAIAPPDGHAAAGFDLRTGLRQRRQLLARMRGDHGARQRHVLARADVLAALARLRTAVRPPPSVAEARLAILAGERQRHGQGVALGDAEADVLDLLDLYYARLWRELRADAAACAHVRRLMLAAVEHAIADADAALALSLIHI